jgi:hypothetical protein
LKKYLYEKVNEKFTIFYNVIKVNKENDLLELGDDIYVARPITFWERLVDNTAGAL